MPQSNKITACLPNLCPIGLQSCCSIHPGSPPPQAVPSHSPAPDPHMAGSPPLQLLGFHESLGYLPLSHTDLQPWDPHYTGIPTPCHWIYHHWDPHHLSALDPSPKPVLQLAGIPTPHPESTTLQALLSPSYVWDDQIPAPLTSRPSGPAWLQLHMEWLESLPTGMGTRLMRDSHIHQPARKLAPWVEIAPALQASQITTPPGSHLGHQ
jgi:hypothetical protein